MARTSIFLRYHVQTGSAVLSVSYSMGIGVKSAV
jgi:hypothetical protein